MKEKLVVLIVASATLDASDLQIPFPGGINPTIRPAGGGIFLVWYLPSARNYVQPLKWPETKL